MTSIVRVLYSDAIVVLKVATVLLLALTSDRYVRKYGVGYKPSPPSERKHLCYLRQTGYLGLVECLAAALARDYVA